MLKANRFTNRRAATWLAALAVAVLAGTTLVSPAASAASPPSVRTGIVSLDVKQGSLGAATPATPAPSGYRLLARTPSPVFTTQPALYWDLCSGNNGNYIFLETSTDQCGSETAKGNTWGFVYASFTSPVHEEVCQYHSNIMYEYLLDQNFNLVAPISAPTGRCTKADAGPKSNYVGLVADWGHADSALALFSS
jgi:hypothetical protein